MPNQPAIGDTLEIRFVCYTASQISINVLHYYVTATAGTTPDLTTIASAFDASVYSYYKVMMSSVNAFYRGVTAKDMTPLQTIAYPWVTHAGAGTSSGNGLPTQDCGLITFRTAYGGAANRGRAYLPFPGALMGDGNGAPSATYITYLGLLAAQWGPNLLITGGAGTISVTQVIRRRKFPFYQDPFVNAYSVQPKMATMRKRGQYGKTNILPF